MSGNRMESRKRRVRAFANVDAAIRSMKANDYDFVRTSVRTLASGMRMSETRSRLALKQLEATGYILRLRYGASRNRTNCL